MGIVFGLDRLGKNKNAVVLDVDAKSDMQERFHDLGIIKGTKIRCLGTNPGKSMAIYEFRGSVIAIRKTDSADIFVSEA